MHRACSAHPHWRAVHRPGKAALLLCVVWGREMGWEYLGVCACQGVMREWANNGPTYWHLAIKAGTPGGWRAPLAPGRSMAVKCYHLSVM